jgi:curved DNA-binding protein
MREDYGGGAAASSPGGSLPSPPRREYDAAGGAHAGAAPGDEMEYRDYYAILGVPREASAEDIKRAYRKLARKYHPDVSKEPMSEARFKELGEAYEVLKDPAKRAAYDRLGTGWRPGQDFRPPPDWDTGFDFGGGGGGGFTDFSDFFEALFGQAAGSGRSRPGAGRRARGPFRARGGDHRARVLIDLEDAYRGAVRTLALQAPETDARGRTTAHERKLEVTIPRGVHAGQELRLAGQGGPGPGGGPPGDLYLEIDFHPHPLYRVEERDVLLDLPLAPWEAALGAAVKVPTPGGMVELKVPAGSAAGDRLRLKGRGIPGSAPGDLYVVLQVVLPPAEGEAARAFYRDMAARFASFHPRANLGT